METHGTVADEDGGAESHAVTDETLETFEDVTQRCGGAPGGAIRGGLRIDLTLEFLLDEGIEREDFEFAAVGEKGLNEGAAERLANGFDESDLRFVDGGGVEKSFENGSEIADGDLLAEQLLQDFLSFAEG